MTTIRDLRTYINSIDEDEVDLPITINHTDSFNTSWLDLSNIKLIPGESLEMLI